jgi:hypothetical protein
MCDANTAVLIIQNYAYDIFAGSQREVQRRSYQQWAVTELCNRIFDNPLKDPIDVIWDFIMEMHSFADYKYPDPPYLIFNVAATFAEEVLLLFV